uniref:Small ribosomal subunit protein uS7 domain-containing protein n=1 Tax=Cebus imitator TaxID=2715852 RepID=A0A2K5PVQ6_CEBIM
MTKWETAAPVVAETPDIKLFEKWSTSDVQINDTSPQDYIAVKEKYYATKHFHKAQCPIEECLTNSMMIHGRNNCKKLMTVCIVKHAFEIIQLLTGENPLQVLVNAADVSPLHRVNHSSSHSYAIKKDELEHVAKSNS